MPCRLSFEDVLDNLHRNNVTKTDMHSKIFLSPDVVVNIGSMFEITQNGRVFHYKSSSKAAIFMTHQEIRLQPVDKWG